MAKKKINRDIDVTVQELLEVRQELLYRLSHANQGLKTAGIILLCLIGVKIALKVAWSIFSLLWSSKLLITAIMFLVLSRKQMCSVRDNEP